MQKYGKHNSIMVENQLLCKIRYKFLQKEAGLVDLGVIQLFLTYDEQDHGFCDQIFISDRSINKDVYG